ncbi:MAG: hypothetical protein AB1641_16125 [Thermodesulfobacteriota bacterium]
MKRASMGWGLGLIGLGVGLWVYRLVGPVQASCPVLEAREFVPLL